MHARRRRRPCGGGAAVIFRSGKEGPLNCQSASPISKKNPEIYIFYYLFRRQLLRGLHRRTERRRRPFIPGGRSNLHRFLLSLLPSERAVSEGEDRVPRGRLGPAGRPLLPGGGGHHRGKRLRPHAHHLLLLQHFKEVVQALGEEHHRFSYTSYLVKLEMSHHQKSFDWNEVMDETEKEFRDCDGDTKVTTALLLFQSTRPTSTTKKN